MAASPSSVYRMLKQAGLLRRWNGKPSKKGAGFVQPLAPHEHWQVDVSYINVCGTFYYLCSLLDGCSRFIVDWELRERMTEREIEILIQRAREAYPGAAPRIISDNGPQFIARDFKEFVRICGMTHVRTSPYYPQSNGKLERWHKSLKSECIRPGTRLSLDDARRLVVRYVEHYNAVRLHSAIGYVTPKDRLEGRHDAIWAQRDRKLEAARERRRQARRRSRAGDVALASARNTTPTTPVPITDVTPATPVSFSGATPAPARHHPAADPLVQLSTTWAEDKATLGSDPSADPGARADDPGGRTATRHPVIRFGTNALNPRRQVEKPLDARREPMCIGRRGQHSISG
ncbi:MAG: DDE-type integrase/transposase/recombinase [Phycisphaerae bacterium]|nr:DDE-type integrase/transposase/recombinase [Phycisphaerae bacterium]